MPDDTEWGPWIVWEPRIEFELRDCWVGFYWDRKIEGGYHGPIHESLEETIEAAHTPQLWASVEMVDVFICLVPWFPLHLHFEREEL